MLIGSAMAACARPLLGASSVILSLVPNAQTNGALTWTSSQSDLIAVVDSSSNLLQGSWAPYYYDVTGNSVQVTPLPATGSDRQFYRLQIRTNAPDPSLVLYLPFDSDFSKGYVLDASGHGGNAYNMNFTNPVTQAVGKWGRGGFWGPNYPMGDYSLGPYLAITNYSSFDILTNGTVSVWAWPDANSGHTTALVDAGYPEMNASWSLRRYYDTRFEFVLWTNNPSIDIHLLRFPTDIISYPDNYGTAAWHHYCVTWQGNGPAVAYYDGVAVATNTLPFPYLQVGSYFHWVAIGCWHHNSSMYPDGTGPNNGWMSGRMDEVRIYSRALPAAEVQALHDGTLP